MFSIIKKLISLNLARQFSSNEVVGVSTGIEHALAQKKLGEKNKQNINDYKSSEYLHFDKFFFYNTEVNLEKKTIFF